MLAAKPCVRLSPSIAFIFALALATATLTTGTTSKNAMGFRHDKRKQSEGASTSGLVERLEESINSLKSKLACAWDPTIPKGGFLMTGGAPAEHPPTLSFVPAYSALFRTAPCTLPQVCQSGRGRSSTAGMERMPTVGRKYSMKTLILMNS